MKKTRQVILATFAVSMFALVANAASYKETTLYNFHGQKDGNGPSSRLLVDASGNFYGATLWGGGGCSGKGCGAIYELSPSASGWTEQIIYAFKNVPDGENPENLLMDASGNIYGTTFAGGANGGGSVFELSPSTSGWTETILYSFTGYADGGSPTSLAFDSAGNLWGTAGSGGAYTWGAVFELSPGSSSWTESVIHSFTGGKDGGNPGGLTFDSAGNMYGITGDGGDTTSCSGGCGTVFILETGSSWTFGLLFTFHGPGGANPVGNLAFDAAGNLYGATRNGGHKYGVVFELTPTPVGSWNETLLHVFNNGTDGAEPTGGLAFDSAGNLYGPANGTEAISPANMFRLTKSSAGGWIYAVVYTYPSQNSGGAMTAPSYIDAAGNLYGTAGGGTGGEGIVYELTPPKK
jgi:uncharacterized repeat protein (TIGR03803 family)